MTGLGGADYHTALAREDYYTAGGEPPGHWVATGSAQLGLTGTVDGRTLIAILNGFDPLTGSKLSQNAGSPKRHTGWDLTFSAPKSVSIWWALATPEVRKDIEEALGGAVEEVLSLLEERCVTTRRGKGGLVTERAKLVAATFLHGTSRAQDPDLHMHVLVPNLGLRADGTWGTIVGHDMFQNKMALGALFRAELSKRLNEKYDLKWRNDSGLIDLKGVPKSVVAAFSKRREEIDAFLKAKGWEGAKASEVASLFTRPDKEHIARGELFEKWRSEAETLGIKKGFNFQKRKHGPGNLPLPKVANELPSRLVERQSAFSAWDLFRLVAEREAGTGAGLKEIVRSAESFLTTTKEVIALGKGTGQETWYSTPALLAAEEEVLSMFEHNTPRPLPTAQEVSKVAEAANLNREQAHALKELSRGRPLTIVAGLAGTGKSSLLRAGRALYESAGLEPIGASLSGKAAEGLEAETGIKSFTVTKLLLSARKGGFNPSPKTVLVIDEAAMVGTLQMRELIKRIVAAGGRVVMVGDEKQIQSIEAGGAFAGLMSKYRKAGVALLKNIQRQRSIWDRARVMELVTGRAARAFRHYAERGKLHIGAGRDEVLERLLVAWGEGGRAKPKEHLILASENRAVLGLNQAAQALRRNAGQLPPLAVEYQGVKFFEGDRVVFTKNLSLIGVKNGSLGTIERIEGTGTLKVRLDSGVTVTVRRNNFMHMTLGYAVTTHKAQGLTAENVYVLLGGSLQDREVSYVQASRARGDTQFFISAEEAGERLKRIVFLAGRSRQKTLATTRRRGPDL